MMWPFKPPQKVPLQQEFVASDVTGVCSFSVNGSHPEDCTHVPAVGGRGRTWKPPVPPEELCWSSGCFFVLGPTFLSFK